MQYIGCQFVTDDGRTLSPDTPQQPLSPADGRRCPSGSYVACPHCKRLQPTYGVADDPLRFMPHPSLTDTTIDCEASWQDCPTEAYRVTRADLLSTCVHPDETTSDPWNATQRTGQSPAPSSTETIWRHSGWKRRRANVRHALLISNQPPKRVESFDRCGADAWIFADPETPGRYRVGSSTCRDRFCQPCATDRAHLIRHNLNAILADRRKEHGLNRRFAFRFVTLTVKTRPGDHLSDTLDNLYAWFKRLRASKLWKTSVSGGAAICELKYIDDTKRWHPHLHVITEGRYIPQDDLRAEWHRITITSHVVDVRAIRDDAECVRYVTKYASKPMAGTIADQPDLLAEAIGATRGRKLLHCFGRWHKYKLLARPDGPDWTRIGKLTTFINRARNGDADALDVLTKAAGGDASDERRALIAQSCSDPP